MTRLTHTGQLLRHCGMLVLMTTRSCGGAHPRSLLHPAVRGSMPYGRAPVMCTKRTKPTLHDNTRWDLLLQASERARPRSLSAQLPEGGSSNGSATAARAQRRCQPALPALPAAADRARSGAACLGAGGHRPRAAVPLCGGGAAAEEAGAAAAGGLLL